MLVKDMEDPKDSFDTKNQSKYLNKSKAESEVKNIYWAQEYGSILRERQDWFQN